MKTITKKELMAMLGDFVSVENTEARCGYGEARNQFEIRFENGRVFQSYKSLIAANIKGQLYLSNKHDYSNTTCLHTKKWTRLTAEERRRGLENEEYILITEN